MWIRRILMDEAPPEGAAGGGGGAPAAPAPDKAAAPAPDKAAAPAASAGTPAPADDGGAAKGYWPEDWQSRMAGGDEKTLKQLSRYASPEDVWKKARALEQRLSSGELKTTLPKDAKPEEIAAWRKDNGIPDAPDKYDLKGITIPEGDKEIIDSFLNTAHGKNFTPEQARAAVESYYQVQARNAERIAARDEEQRVSVLDTLNQEWGGQFRRNVNLIEGLLAKFPESVRDAIKSARLPDGTAAFNSADVVKGFAALALELNPAGIVTPGGVGDVGKVALEEYRDLQKFMRENRAEYNKDQGKQNRMTELIEHLSKNGLIDGNGNEIRKAA